MSSFHNARSSASSAVLKLLAEYDPSVKSVADLKNGYVLLNLFQTLGLTPQKNFHNVKNPFQFMKKYIKKSSEKDLFQRVNLDMCEKGNEAELLLLSSCLLCRWHSQQKENSLQASDVLTEQEAKLLWAAWIEMQPYSFSSESSRSSLFKSEPLKEYNFSPKSGSPYKRTGETPCALKKEIHKKEICITNLRSLLDEEQERISELIQGKKDNEYQISTLEKMVKEQKEKLSAFKETSKLSHDVEEFQQTIQSLTREKEKLLLRVKEFNDTKREVTVLESENEDLRNIKDSLNAKVSNLEGSNKRLTNEIQDWQRKQCESGLLQQRLDILYEELKVKEDTITELNNMIAVYQDKLDTQKIEKSAFNMDSSDCGEIVGLVCSSFHNTSCELTSLQNEVNNLQHQKDSLESDIMEIKETLQKSINDNSKLEKEVYTLQKIVDHLNSEGIDNQAHIAHLNKQIVLKDSSIADLVLQKNSLTSEVEKLVAEISEVQDQLVSLKDDQVKALIVIQQHEDEIQRGRNEIGKLQNDLVLANQQKGAVEEQVKTMDEEGRALKAQASVANCKIETFLQELKDLEMNICQLNLLNSEQADVLVSLKKDKCELEGAFSDLQRKHADLITSYEETRTEKEGIVFELNKLHADYLMLQEEQVNLQVRLNSFREDNDHLQKEITNADTEKSRLLEMTEELRLEKSGLTRELEDVQVQILAAQSHNCNLQEKVDRLTLQRCELQKTICEIELKHTEICEKYNLALKTIEELNLKLLTTKQELENQNGVNNELQLSFSSLKNQHDILQEEQQLSLLQNRAISQEIAELREQHNAARKKVQEGEVKILELNENMKLAAETNDKFSVQIEALMKQKSMYMEKSMQLEQEVNSLQQMKNILSEQIAELLNEKMTLQLKLRQREETADANTSTCSFSSSNDDSEMSESPTYCEKDALIENLESQLTISEEKFKTELNDKENENAQLSRKVETLLLDLKGKEKYMAYLELEKQQALERHNLSASSFEKEMGTLQENYKVESVRINKKIKDLEEELGTMNLLKEHTLHEISKCKERIVLLEEELKLILAEKSEVIGALCEKEEKLKVLQESLNESKNTNIEMSGIIDNKNEMVISLEIALENKSAEMNRLLSELENKTSELGKLSQVQTELISVKNKLVECESSHVKNLDMFCRERDNFASEKESLIISLDCKTTLIEELTGKLLSSAQANDVLVAETVSKASELLSLQEASKKSTSELQSLKSILTSHKENEINLQDCVKKLTNQLELASEKEASQFKEIEDLRNNLTNNEQYLLEANQKIRSFESVALTNKELREEQHCLEMKIKDYEKQVSELRNCPSLLSKDDVIKCDISFQHEKTEQQIEEKDMESLDNAVSVHNPALKQWLDQFDSLSQKIQEMRNSYPEKSKEINVPTISNFENDILTMIREHIHCWFTSTEFLFEERSSESQFFKHLAEQQEKSSKVINTNSQETSTNTVKVRAETTQTSPLKLCSSVVQTLASMEAEPCDDCLTKAKSCTVLETELFEKCKELNIAQEKLLLIEKKCDTKEREASLYKEALSMCQQKITDLKQHHDVQKLKYRQEVVQAKEENAAMQAKLEAVHNKFRDTEKKYLEEMKLVHKKFQEKINLYNTTSKDLSHTKMQMVNLSKQHADLLESYRRCEDKLMNANTSLKKQRLENESLKTELRNIQRTVQQTKQQEYNSRRMSFLPNSSFMQQSNCSTFSCDTSLDSSVFIKPFVPPSRFACDEEEGQFLDQSRNISELKEGRVEPITSESRRGRLEELQRRNTLCRPHLRTHYPVETQSMLDESNVCIEELTRTPQVGKKTLRQSTSQPLPSTSTNVSKAAEGQRKRKEWSQVPVDMNTPAKKTSTVSSQPSSSKKKNQNRKAPFYKVFSPFRKEKPKNFSL